MGAQQSTLRTESAYNVLARLRHDESCVIVGNGTECIKIDLPQSVKTLLEDLDRFNWTTIYEFDKLNIQACSSAIECYLTAHDGNISGKRGSFLEVGKGTMEYHLRHIESSAETMTTRRKVFMTTTAGVNGSRSHGDYYQGSKDIHRAWSVTTLSLNSHASDLRRALGMLKRLCTVALMDTTTTAELEVFYNWFRYGQATTPQEVIEKRREELAPSVISSAVPTDALMSSIHLPLPGSHPEQTDAEIEAQWIANAEASAGSNSAASAHPPCHQWIPQLQDMLNALNPFNEDEDIESITVINSDLEESPVPSSKEENRSTSDEATKLGDEARANAMGVHEDSTIPPIEEAKALLALALREERKGLKVYDSTIALCNSLIESYDGMHTESILRLFPIIESILSLQNRDIVK